MSSKQAFRLEQLSDRAKGYGMPGVDVDGNDVQAVYDAVDEAVSRARAGSGPSFIVANTYRWRGHSKSDKNLYRTREEIDEWRTKDPIGRFEDEVLKAGALDQEAIDSVQDRVRSALRDAVVEATKGADANADDLLDAQS